MFKKCHIIYNALKVNKVRSYLQQATPTWKWNVQCSNILVQAFFLSWNWCILLYFHKNFVKFHEIFEKIQEYKLIWWNHTDYWQNRFVIVRIFLSLEHCANAIIDFSDKKRITKKVRNYLPNFTSTENVYLSFSLMIKFLWPKKQLPM